MLAPDQLAKLQRLANLRTETLMYGCVLVEAAVLAALLDDYEAMGKAVEAAREFDAGLLDCECHHGMRDALAALDATASEEKTK